MEKLVEYINFDSSNKFTLIFTSTTSRPVTRGNSGMSLHSKSHSPVFRKISGTKVSNPHYNDSSLITKKQHQPQSHATNSSMSNHFSEQNRHNSVTLASRSHTATFDNSNDLDKSFNQREDSFIIGMDDAFNTSHNANANFTNNANNNNNFTPLNNLNDEEMFDQLLTKVRWIFWFNL
jgi:hypothetical protein